MESDSRSLVLLDEVCHNCHPPLVLLSARDPQHPSCRAGPLTASFTRSVQGQTLLRGPRSASLFFGP